MKRPTIDAIIHMYFDSITILYLHSNKFLALHKLPTTAYAALWCTNAYRRIPTYVSCGNAVAIATLAAAM